MRLKREPRALGRKLEQQKKRGEKPATKRGRNIDKNVLKIQKMNVQSEQLDLWIKRGTDEEITSSNQTVNNLKQGSLF